MGRRYAFHTAISPTILPYVDAKANRQHTCRVVISGQASIYRFDADDLGRFLKDVVPTLKPGRKPKPPSDS
jgi:hypothetical protein